MCASLAFLDALSLAIHSDPPPLPADLHPAAYELARRGYDDHAIRRAVGVLAMLGTAQGCEFVDEEDRDAIEETLPVRPYAEWAAFDDHVYGLGRGA